MENHCKGCNLCCNKYTISVFPITAHKIAKFLGLGYDGFVDKYLDYYIEFYDVDKRNILFKVEDEQIKVKYGHYYFLSFAIKSKGACPFLKKGACAIYEVRPIQCRMYPNYKYYGEEYRFCKLDKLLKIKDPRKYFSYFEIYNKNTGDLGLEKTWGYLPKLKHNLVVLVDNKKVKNSKVLIDYFNANIC